jgi:CSLREA domain-containing protein
MSHRSPLALCSAWAALVVGMLLPSRSGATDYAITSFVDVVAADGACTLREAIRAAESNLAVNECAAGGLEDTIVLQSTGIYSFFHGDEPVTNGPLTIRGLSGVAADHVIDLQSVNRFLRVQSNGRITLEGLTLDRGSSVGATPPSGGALRAALTEVVLRDVVISSCTAGEDGGGLFASSVTNGLTMERVRFVDNLVLGTVNNPWATGGGASIRVPTATLSDVLFDGNRSLSLDAGGRAFGGAMQLTVGGPADSRSTLRALQVRNNEAEGALSSQAAGVLAAVSPAGRLVIEDSSFADNALVTNPAGVFGVALVAIADQQTSIDLRRLRVSGSGAGNTQVAQVMVSAQGGSTVVVDSVAIHHSPTSGLFLSAFEDGLLVAGQLTVTSHDAVGVKVSGLSSLPIRLENSILWGNGPGGNDDVSVTGTIDAGHSSNHLWIGELGDPDPRFVNPATADFGLQASSGALDAGAASFPSVGPYDAAHAQRVIGPGLDLGAFERSGLFADSFEAGGLWAWKTITP